MDSTCKYYALLLFPLLITNCHTKKMSTSSAFVYIDQNNDSYKINLESIEFFPLNTALGSSGIISDKHPWKNNMSKQKFIEIQNIIKKLIAATNFHTIHRIKTTAIIKINDQSFIVKPSDTRAELEEILRLLKPTDNLE